MESKNIESDNISIIITYEDILCDVTRINSNISENNSNNKLRVIDNYKLLGELNVDGHII